MKRHIWFQSCVCGMGRLPLVGVIRLDCITSKEKHFKHVIDQQRLQNFIANLTRSRMSDNERLALVAIFAPYHYFTCHQCHEVLSSFGMGNEKVQAALLLNFRSAMLCTQYAVLPDVLSTCDSFCCAALCVLCCTGLPVPCCARLGWATCAVRDCLCCPACAVLYCPSLCCAPLGYAACAMLCWAACAGLGWAVCFLAVLCRAVLSVLSCALLSCSVLLHCAALWAELCPVLCGRSCSNQR